MKDVEIVIKQNFFDTIGVEIAQVKLVLDEEKNEGKLNGSITLKKSLPKKCTVWVEGALCDSNGDILKIICPYAGSEFLLSPFDTFTLYWRNVSGLLNEVESIALYPHIRREK